VTRTIPSGYLSAMESESSEFVHLISLDFSGGTIYINTGAADLVWAGQTWEGVGGNLQLGAVEESRDASAQGVDLSLSGVDQSILSALLSYDYRGRVCQVYRAHLNPTTGAVITDPQLLFEGLQVAAFEVTEQRDSRNGGTVTVKTSIRGRMGVDRRKGIISSLVGHQRYFPGDTFWQNAMAVAAAIERGGLWWGNHQVQGGGPYYDPGENSGRQS
jgi:hypothetical protein